MQIVYVSIFIYTSYWYMGIIKKSKLCLSLCVSHKMHSTMFIQKISWAPSLKQILYEFLSMKWQASQIWNLKSRVFQPLKIMAHRKKYTLHHDPAHTCMCAHIGCETKFLPTIRIFTTCYALQSILFYSKSLKMSIVTD